MNFKPLFDRVVIDPNVEENESKSGIVLPGTAQERPQIGVVVAVGDGENFDCNKTDMRVQVGDKVLFEKYAGISIHKYFLKLKFKVATKLLKEGLSVSEVSEKLNFSSQSYFSVSYKREMRISPSEI